jgi:hypothetical protein
VQPAGAGGRPIGQGGLAGSDENRAAWTASVPV